MHTYWEGSGTKNFIAAHCQKVAPVLFVCPFRVVSIRSECDAFCSGRICNVAHPYAQQHYWMALLV
jgi:hypothetical protein